MEAEDFSKETSIKITLGHLLLAWEVLSDKFSDLQSNDSLQEEERRAIWGLADLLENSLAENDVTGKPQAEWAVLISKSKEYMKTVPVDFLEQPGAVRDIKLVQTVRFAHWDGLKLAP